MELSRRGLLRVAAVAAEAGARFQREATPGDAVAWLLAPRPFFGGRPAIEACVGLAPFRRALLLHALSLTEDAAAIDPDAGLPDLEGAIGVPSCCGPDLPNATAVAAEDRAVGKVDRPSAVVATFAPRVVHSATVVAGRDAIRTVAFHARLAHSGAEVAAAVADRHPGHATITGRRGFDAGHPLLSPALVAVLDQADGWRSGGSLEVDLVVRRSPAGLVDGGGGPGMDGAAGSSSSPAPTGGDVGA